MKDFVFIVPLTPSKASTPFRAGLFQLMLNSLRKQTSDNWQAILVGEEDKIEGNLVYIPAKAIEPGYVIRKRSLDSATDKHFKIEVALQYIARQDKKPKYLIRLDDDDVFSPAFLKEIEGKNHDCFIDKFHTYYDVSSGRICQNNVSWFPNTTIHKYAHAISIIPAGVTVDEPECALIASSHNKTFHKYYKDRNVYAADKSNPIYLRTITPGSVSFTQQKDKLDYKDYISRYGDWYYIRLENYEPYIVELIALTEKYLNIKINRDFGGLQKTKDKVSNLSIRNKRRIKVWLRG